MAIDDGFGIGMGWDGVEFFLFLSFFSCALMMRGWEEIGRGNGVGYSFVPFSKKVHWFFGFWFLHLSFLFFHIFV